MSKKEIIRNIAIGFTLLSLIAMFCYLIADKLNSKMSLAEYQVIHTVIVNSLCISLVIIVMTFLDKYFSIYFGLVFIPLFILKTLYDITCYFHIMIESQRAWANIWRGVIAYYIIAALIVYFCWLIKRDHYGREN